MKKRPKQSSRRSESIYPTLDLHGYSGDEAARLTEHWLLQAQREGELAVRVITGKGTRSIGLPVLPNVVDALLQRLKGAVVADYEPEAGHGSLLIKLRPPAPSLPSKSPLKGVSPDLIRQAEDSLAELGIAPTPTLVAAEVRRITKERG